MKTAIALLLLSCFLAASHAFMCEEAPRYYGISYMDAGHGMVVAATRYRAIMLAGTYWSTLSSVRLTQVSIGPSGLWGTDSGYKVYKMVGGKFLEARGLKMKMVEAGGDGFVMGIGAHDSRMYCLRRSSASAFRGGAYLSWTSKHYAIQQMGCGKKGCWAVDSHHRVYVMWNINCYCGSSTWVRVSGYFKAIEVGEDGRVFGLMPNGVVCERMGISSHRPTGSYWHEHRLCFRVEKLAYNLGRLWIASKTGLLLECRG